MRAAALLLVALLGSPSHAATATIHPGVRTTTNGTVCTSNFVFHDSAGARYLGQAAHCAALGPGNDGCVTAAYPLGTQVAVEGASRPGVLVYSSWNAMQAANESDPDACTSNDFALVRLDPADYSRVDPTMPFWGGPTGTGGTAQTGDFVYTSGNDATGEPRPRVGVVVATGSGWSHGVVVLTSGPADDGMGVLDRNGRALGILTPAAVPAGHGLTDLGHVLAYAVSHGGPSVSLALGTEPFQPPI